jgi:localization factor PodJL
MTKALYRSFKSSSEDSRQVRRAAARRSDRERDDWRDDVHEMEDDFDERDDRHDVGYHTDDEDRLEAVTRRLARSSARGAERQEPRRWRDAPPHQAESAIDPDEIAENAAALVSRRVAASERHTARALENIAEMIESTQRRFDPQVIDEAVAAFERRAGETERKTAKALENLAGLLESSTQKRPREQDGLDVVMDRLGRIESKIAQQPESANPRPIRSALARLESRIDRLSGENRTADFEQALSGLDQRLADIAARLDVDTKERQVKLSTLESPSHVAMERGLETARLPAMRRALDDGGPAPAPRGKRPLADAIAEITRRQNALDSEEAAPQRKPERPRAPALDEFAASTRFEDLHGTIEGISRRLENVQSGIGDRSDQQLVLMRQVESLRRQIEESTRLESPVVARRFEDLGKTVEKLSHQIEDVGRLEHPAVARRFDKLDDTVEALSDQLFESSRNEHPSTARRFEQLADTLGMLARQIEDASRTAHPAVARGFDQLGETVAVLARHIDEASRSEHPVTARRFDQLSGQVEALGRQIEQASRTEHPALSSRFDQLAETVEKLAHQIEEASRNEHPAVARGFGQMSESVERLSRQVANVHNGVGQNVDRQERIVKEIEGLREEIEGLSHTLGELAPRASITSIETALHELAHRIDAQRDRGVIDAALAPAERIAGELRAVMKDLDPGPLVRNLHADVRAIARRLDEMGGLNNGDPKALSDLSRQTSEIKELLGALASRPLPLEKLETRLFDLTQRVDNLSVVGAAAGSSREIGEVVKAIRSIVATETSNGFQAFNQRLERLSGKVEEALAKSGAKRFDELDARIDSMHKSLAQRIDRSVTAQKPVDTSAIENLVATLAKKIDSALDAKSHNPAFDELGRKIEKLEARLHDPSAAQSIARIETLLASPGQEGHFAELAQRIDNIGKTLTSRFEQDGFAHSGVDLSHIEDLVRRLGDRIDAALEPGAGRRDLEQLEYQVEQLSQKLDKLGDYPSTARIEELLSQPAPHIQLNELSDRIDFMHNALAARIEASTRAKNDSSSTQLSDLVEQLSHKMNNALDPNADSGVLNSLETQIRQLSQRLDNADCNGSALASIEHKIADLFARIEETRTTASDAAEAAVRRATLDVLRQAAQMPGGVNPAVKEEIEEIRRVQDETGARTHETLSAVHETLERVVDRLAEFEDELTEIRNAPPARDFAPAPQAAREPLSAERESPRAPARPHASQAPSAATAQQPMTADPRGRRSRDIDDLDLDLASLGKAESRAVQTESTQSAFIAAARRAAQQVAAEAEAEEAARKASRQAGGGMAATGSVAALAGVGSTIAARKRPLLLGLGAVVMLLGAYAAYATFPGGGASRVAPAPEQTSAARPLDGSPSALDQNAQPAGTSAPAQADAAPVPQKTELSPIAPLPRMATPRGDTPTPADGSKAPALGLQPIGPAGGGPTLAPRAAGKAALGEQVDNTPVGAIGRSNASPQDTAAAIKTLAMNGDATAQYELGARYADGRGLPRDNKAAAQWFEKAAEQGLAPAQYRLGSYYEKGIGVDRDYARARKLYQQAAEAGNARAMHNLAVLAAEGNDGKPDYGLASDWFRRAAEFGVRDSQYNLAILYARGLGVGQSMTQSYLWFAVAADQGDADAAKKRDEVGARLDSKELAAAKALVDGFKPHQPKHEANDVTPPKGGWESLKAPDLPPIGKPAATGAKPKMSQI